MSFLAPGVAASLKRSARIQWRTGTNFNSITAFALQKAAINHFFNFWKAVKVVPKLGLVLTNNNFVCYLKISILKINYTHFYFQS